MTGRADQPNDATAGVNPDGDRDTVTVGGLGRDLASSVGGYELVLSGVLFALAGVWIDGKLGTTPLFIIVMSVLGFGGSAANIYYRYRKEMDVHDAAAAARRKQG